MSVPPRDMVQSHRDARRDLDQRLTACHERIHNAELEMDRHIRAYERIARDEHAVSPEELASVRQHRDSGWSLIRQKYVEGISIPEDELREFYRAGWRSLPMSMRQPCVQQMKQLTGGSRRPRPPLV